MSNPICLSPLKFYDALEKQERYKSYAYGHVSPVVMPFKVIYPFQFVVPYTPASGYDGIAQVFLRDTNGNLIAEIAPSLKEFGLEYKNVNGHYVIFYPGFFPIQAITEKGQYYLEIKLNVSLDDGQVGNVSYYSEIFCFTDNLNDFVEIEYWNHGSNIGVKGGIITFADGFHFKILIDSELGKPEYSFEEESTSRLGYNFIESQVSKKIYKFNSVLPEYICDAIRLIRLCSDKKLTTKGETYEMLSFDMDVDWQEQGDLASVTCEFEVDNVIVNAGGFKDLSQGDFNTDFNNDYDVEN